MELDVSLRIESRTLTAAQISDIVGCTPSLSHDRGELRESLVLRETRGERYESTVWVVDSTAGREWPLLTHLTSLLSQIPPEGRLATLRSRSEVAVDIVVGVFADVPFVTLRVDTQSLEIARRYRAEIQFTTYPGNDEEGEEAPSPKH